MLLLKPSKLDNMAMKKNLSNVHVVDPSDESGCCKKETNGKLLMLLSLSKFENRSMMLVRYRFVHVDLADSILPPTGDADNG